MRGKNYFFSLGFLILFIFLIGAFFLHSSVQAGDCIYGDSNPRCCTTTTTGKIGRQYCQSTGWYSTCAQCTIQKCTGNGVCCSTMLCNGTCCPSGTTDCYNGTSCCTETCSCKTNTYKSHYCLGSCDVPDNPTCEGTVCIPDGSSWSCGGNSDCCSGSCISGTCCTKNTTYCPSTVSVCTTCSQGCGITVQGTLPCSGTCVGGVCVTNTSTPTKTPTPTQTPTPTPTTAPTCGMLGQIPCSGNLCNPNLGVYNGLCRDALFCAGIIKCENDKRYQCNIQSCPLTTRTDDGDALTCTSWTYQLDCVNGCKDAFSCNEPGYCIDLCNTTDYGCTTNTTTYCWSSYDIFSMDSKPYSLGIEHCYDTANCVNDACTPLSARCNIPEQLDPTCQERYGNAAPYEWINNCYNYACLSTFCDTGGGTGPTPTSCSPNCTGSDTYCAGTWFNAPNGCGICAGSLNCTGNISAIAKIVTSATPSCDEINNSSTYGSGSTFTLDPTWTPGSIVQSGSSAVTWSAAPSGTYSLSVTQPTGYIVGNICARPNDSSGYTQSSSVTLQNAVTGSFIVGLVPQPGWVQVSGGDAYARTTLASSIPPTATNRLFITNSTNISAGIAAYGGSYDYDVSNSSLGEGYVSPTNNWLVNHTNTITHWYQSFAQKMDIPGSATPFATDVGGNVAKPTCGATTPCVAYVNSDAIVNSAWTIDAAEKLVLFVNGNLTINSPITITSGGFFAVIVNGNITVSPNVGTTVAGTLAQLEGIYIATNDTHTAVFNTGVSTTLNKERLIVKGMVIADAFTLLRDVGVANNQVRPASIFLYNPNLLFAMPDEMKDLPFTWQEVAP